jgi:hypothetical protein
VPPDPQLGAPAASICTATCATDADCDANPETMGDGYCSEGHCRLGAGPNAPCMRHEHCRTSCLLDASGVAGTCAP